MATDYQVRCAFWRHARELVDSFNWDTDQFTRADMTDRWEMHFVFQADTPIAMTVMWEKHKPTRDPNDTGWDDGRGYGDTDAVRARAESSSSGGGPTTKEILSVTVLGRTDCETIAGSFSGGEVYDAARGIEMRVAILADQQSIRQQAAREATETAAVEAAFAAAFKGRGAT